MAVSNLLLSEIPSGARDPYRINILQDLRALRDFVTIGPPRFASGLQKKLFANCFSCPSHESQTSILTTSRRWRKLLRLPDRTQVRRGGRCPPSGQLGVRWLSWASRSKAF